MHDPERNFILQQGLENPGRMIPTRGSRRFSFSRD
jgi:hypothetical protein